MAVPILELLEKLKILKSLLCLMMGAGIQANNIDRLGSSGELCPAPLAMQRAASIASIGEGEGELKLQ